MVQLIALLAQTHMKHTHITHPPFVPLFGALVCSRTPFGPLLTLAVAHVVVFPFPSTILSPVLVCTRWVEGLLWVGWAFHGQRALSPSSYLTHACYTLQNEGLRARLQISDCAHLQRLTNDDDRKILSGSADVQWGTWFPRGSWIALFANLPTFPPNQSTGALLNVNKVFMLLTHTVVRARQRRLLALCRLWIFSAILISWLLLFSS